MQAKLRNCQFIVPSFQSYGGLSGFHDYGTNGIIVKNKLLDYWRKSFLRNSNIREIETPIITPGQILKASGHVDRFTDYIVCNNDMASSSTSFGTSFRADHLVKEYFTNNGMMDLANKVDAMSMEELEEVINNYHILEGENIKVTTKNLMYKVDDNYLRPELAQGLFVIFKQQKQSLPFGLAQTGKAYRNEISPKQFTRMREFTLAEIEYFVDPEHKTHHNYDQIKDLVIPIYPKSPNDKLLNISICDAVNQNIISTEIMGYFMSKIYKFAIDIGLDKNRIRFRQHNDNELAHYALECWDLEAFVDNDWLECIGCADRGSYDLEAHGQYSQKTINPPIVKKELVININKVKIGRELRKESKLVIKHLDNFNSDQIIEMKLAQELKKNKQITVIIDDVPYIINDEMIEIIEIEKKISTIDFYAHTIEPSFGIDRLLYVIFDHSFWARKEDKNRTIFSLPTILLPYDIAVFQLHNKPDMIAYVNKIVCMLDKHDYSCYTDSSHTAIGKRYSRVDEIGIKYAITVDPGTLKDNMVTIRSRDSMIQDRVHVDDIISTLQNKLNF